MPYLIPKEWMGPAPGVKRAIFHWTAGSYQPSATDREHYHFIIAGDGTIHRGEHTPADNLKTGDGDYAAHVRGINTGSIGISVCCMMGARETPFDPGPYPLRVAQWNNLIRGCADLCAAYGIAPDQQTLLGHHEVERVLGKPQKGKWDIKRVPFPLRAGYQTTGAELRGRVKLLLAGNLRSAGLDVEVDEAEAVEMEESDASGG